MEQDMTEYMVHVVGDAELHLNSEAKSIRLGSSVVTDDPFAETAEQLGGFYLVETDNLDDLLGCRKLIAAMGDGIEVWRPVDPAERPS
jgi:hypothetical protein